VAPLEAFRKQYPDQVLVLAGDLGDESLGKKAVDQAIAKWGQLDSLILNHGVLDPCSKIVDLDMDAWKKSWDINFFGCIGLVSLIQPRAGRSIGVSSTVGVLYTDSSCRNYTGQSRNPTPSHFPWQHPLYLLGCCHLGLSIMGLLWRNESGAQSPHIHTSRRGARNHEHICQAWQCGYGHAGQHSRHSCGYHEC
jgi:short chain dehydrogenase